MAEEARVRLKEIRKRLGISTTQVEECSRRIAEAESRKEFLVSSARLAQIENQGSTPSAFKLYSLSVIYRVRYADLLRLYGIDLDQTEKHLALIPRVSSEVSRLEVYKENAKLTFPVRLDPAFDANLTQSLSRLVEIWAEIPIGMFQHLRPIDYHYGYVGLSDRMMDPLIRPGSIVTIDTRRDKVQHIGWKSEFDRPIYFVELRDGYQCAWCELKHNRLTLIPHPMSPCGTETYSLPTEAEIVGQVVAVAMRLVPPVGRKAVDAPKRRALP